jgi:hypothetical protein
MVGLPRGDGHARPVFFIGLSPNSSIAPSIELTVDGTHGIREPQPAVFVSFASLGRPDIVKVLSIIIEFAFTSIHEICG